MSSSVQQTAKQGIKFGLVGISGIGVNFVVLTIGLYVFHLSNALAVGLSILCSMSSNYMFNRIWTFKSTKEKKFEYFRYISLNLVGSLIQYGVTLGLETLFIRNGFTGLQLIFFVLPSIYIASLCGIFLGFISNFLSSKFLVFR